MDNLEEQFLYLEIEAELQQLKQQLHNRGSQNKESQNKSATNTRCTPPITEKNKCHYETLGLQPGASLQEIKYAYKTLAKKWHPDLFHNNPLQEKKAQEQFQKIQEAYEALTITLPKT